MSRDGFNVVQISDLHIDPVEPETIERVRMLRPLIAELEPDLIIASGDVTNNGYMRAGDFQHAVDEFKAYAAPVHVIPGNHDVGEVGGTDPITQTHLDRFKHYFGDDRFCIERDRWSLIGINSLRIGSHLDAEQEQFDWLDAQLDRAEADGRLVALFMHQPPYLHQPDEHFGDHTDYWALKPPGRDLMLERLRRSCVRLWANGHVHWHKMDTTPERIWVWCPPASTVVNDAKFPAGGDVLGIMTYHFNADSVKPTLIELDLPKRTYLFRYPELTLPPNVAGGGAVSIAHIVINHDGLHAGDGALPASVAERLTRLSHATRVTMLTADTTGRVAACLADLPVTVATVETGHDKSHLVEERELPVDGPSSSVGLPGVVVAIGMTLDDMPMLEVAAIGIAIVGPHGADPELTRVAQVVVETIDLALDVLLDPQRLERILQE